MCNYTFFFTKESSAGRSDEHPDICSQTCGNTLPVRSNNNKNRDKVAKKLEALVPVPAFDQY